MLKTKDSIRKLVSLITLCLLLTPAIGFAADEHLESSPKPIFIPYGVAQTELGVIKESAGIQPEAPLSFFVDGNTYGILDTVKKRIVLYKNERFIKDINLDFTNYPKDLLLLERNVYVLDEAEPYYNVYKLTMDGEIQEQYTVDIPDFDFTTNAIKWLGVTKHDTAAVIDCAYNEYELENSTKGVKKGVKGISSNGKRVYGKTGKDGKMILVLPEDNKENILDINCISAGAEILGSDNNKDIFVMVGDRANTSQVIIEATVRKFNKTNDYVGVVRLPLEESLYSPTRSVFISPTGEVYFMALKVDGVEVKQLTLDRTYKSDIKEKEAAQISVETYTTKPGQDSSILAVNNSRQTTNDRAYSINNLSWSYTAANNNPPPGTSSPDWLGKSYGTKTGIPYCWGGFDAIDRSSAPSSWANFTDAMSKSKFAGNVTCTGSYKAGTAGLDCAGYVGACLGYTWRPSTVNLWDNSIQVQSATWMDSYNNRNSHVMLFLNRLTDGTGISTCESTTSGNDKCKVYSRTYTWLNNGGYQCRTFW